MNARLEVRSNRARIRETDIRNNTLSEFIAQKNAPETKYGDAGELPEVPLQNKSAARRSPRTVRFSDVEWEKIEQAARAINISSATFTRDAALSAAADRQAASSGVLPPEFLKLIKRIYRSTYMLSTLKRDEMIRDGGAREVDKVVRAARNAQEDVIHSQSLCHDPPDV